MKNKKEFFDFGLKVKIFSDGNLIEQTKIRNEKDFDNIKMKYKGKFF